MMPAHSPLGRSRRAAPHQPPRAGGGWGRRVGRRWPGRGAFVGAKAGAKVLSELLTHRAKPGTDVPRGRRWRTHGWLHQKPEHQVEDDADPNTGRENGKDDEDDAHQQWVDTEVGGEARTDASDNAIRPTPQGAPGRLAHGAPIIALRAPPKKRGRAWRALAESRAARRLAGRRASCRRCR